METMKKKNKQGLFRSQQAPTETKKAKKRKPYHQTSRKLLKNQFKSMVSNSDSDVTIIDLSEEGNQESCICLYPEDNAAESENQNFPE